MRSLDVTPYIGKPFVDGGRGPLAYDCIGLVIAVYRDLFGVKLPDYDIGATAIAEVADMFRTETRQDSPRWTRVPAGTTPSVVVMALHDQHPRLVNHAGVCLDGSRVLHTTQGVGAHIFRLPSLLWGHRIKGYYAWTPQPA